MRTPASTKTAASNGAPRAKPGESNRAVAATIEPGRGSLDAFMSRATPVQTPSRVDVSQTRVEEPRQAGLDGQAGIEPPASGTG